MIQPLVSVIMAVYNAEPYLRRCLDSLQAQTLTEFDVIAVDDGSTDESLAILKEYASKDTRFRIYHKENGGVSSARQFGIERLAEQGGKYSIHVDPDDWVEPRMLEQLYKKAEETGADMVICDYHQDGQKQQWLRRQDPGSEEPQEVLNALFLGLHGSLCNKLIRTDCYKEAGIRFPEGLNYCEDFYVNVCLLLRSVRKVSYLPEAFYHYDKYSNPQAETRSSDKEYVNYSRQEIVRLCREALPKKDRNWSFGVFEVKMACSIIKKGDMKNSEFRSLFSGIPLSILFHSLNFKTIIVLLALHTPIGNRTLSGTYRCYRACGLRIARSIGLR